MRLLIDTSILSDNLRGGNVLDSLLDRMESEIAELFVPTIVVFELFSGSSTKDLEVTEKIKVLLSKFELVDLTNNVAVRAGILYRDVNKNLGIADYVIAASAIELQASLVSLNTKHFKKISELS